METVVINGKARSEFGKKGTKAVRSEGGIPCVIYGGKEPVHFSTIINDVKHLIYTPDFKVAEITAGGKVQRCILKAVQYHPVTDSVMHIDFQEIVADRKIIVDVPLRFKGVSPGVKAGGKLLQNMRKAKVKSMPEHMVSELMLDISKMELGSAIRVRDIEVPANVEIMHNGSIPVAIIEIPRALRGKS